MEQLRQIEKESSNNNIEGGSTTSTLPSTAISMGHTTDRRIGRSALAAIANFILGPT
jgi:hypothetical protein